MDHSSECNLPASQPTRPLARTQVKRLERDRLRKAISRSQESPQQREQRLAKVRSRAFTRRTRETSQDRQLRLAALRRHAHLRSGRELAEARARRLADLRHRARIHAQTESPAARCARMADMQERFHNRLANEAPEEAAQQRARDQLPASQEDDDQRRRRLRRERFQSAANKNNNTTTLKDWQRSAFDYTAAMVILTLDVLQIGEMKKKCNYCQALLFPGETSSLCCANGAVRLPPLPDIPNELDTLMASRAFRTNIRAYNSAFQFTSIEANEIHLPGYNPSYIVQGQLYHRIGSLMPDAGQPHNFAQIYWLGGQANQVARRHELFPQLDNVALLSLTTMFHRDNALVRGFIMAIEQAEALNIEEYKIILHAHKQPQGEHERRYNIPTCNEVAALIINEEGGRRDLIMQRRVPAGENPYQRLSETHRYYDPMQYPLLFPHGDSGYEFHIKRYKENKENKHWELSSRNVTPRDFYRHRLMVRDGQSRHLFRCGKLFQQYIVDMYLKMELQRINYLRFNQSKLRVETYSGLTDAMLRDGDATNVGKLIVLPASFTGSPRYMQKKRQDGMAIARRFGNGDLFTTLTANALWYEIASALEPGQRAADRPEIVARVFHLKNKLMHDLICTYEIFGPIKAYMRTIEWQKRGLPHCHSLYWFEEKLRPNQIDDIISAEIPDKDLDPDLYAMVTRYMIHGPCGPANPNAPCMKNGKCIHGFPKAFTKHTHVGDNGYPNYRRRSPQDGGQLIVVYKDGKPFHVDNRWVVPYCPMLLRIMRAHLNVEKLNSIHSLKYITKYILKGTDQSVLSMERLHGDADGTQVRDEITQYQNGRYVGSGEASWGILPFDIHERRPAVEMLKIHLPGEQIVVFDEDHPEERVGNLKLTQLEAFFILNQNDDFAKTLLYSAVPEYYTFNKQRGAWNPRAQGSRVPDFPHVRHSTVIGRIVVIHPTKSELFHLRLLLHHVRGPTSFQDLRTKDDIVYLTFREACEAHGLLENDEQWISTLEEAAFCSSPRSLRQLLAILIHVSQVPNPLDLWNQFRDDLCEDFLLSRRRTHGDQNLTFRQQDYDEGLYDLGDRLAVLGGSSLEAYGLPTPRSARITMPRVIAEHQDFDIDEMQRLTIANESRLNDEQRRVYDEVLDSVSSESGKMFFLYASGGTGKTFLLNTILTNLRSRSAVALAVASSGIAATLLPGGRTAHSMFKLPLDVVAGQRATCNIKRGTALATVIERAALIIWDEATMANRASIEALDRTLRDIRRNPELPFGGITFLMSGDFRQTIPVVTRGTRADEVNACIKRSPLWTYMYVLTLTQNMRVLTSADAAIGQFAQQLLELGAGAIRPDDQGTVTLPFGIHVRTLAHLEDAVYPNLGQEERDPEWYSSRAILAPTNASVRVVNTRLTARIQGAVTEYLSRAVS